MAGEGSRAVRKTERASRGDGDDVRAVARAIGCEGHRSVETEGGERGDEGQIRVRDDREVDASFTKVRDRGADGPRKSASRGPEHARALARGEGRDLVVVAGDVGGKRASRRQHPRSELAREGAALGGSQDGGQAELGEAERLDRHDERAHGASLGSATVPAAGAGGRYRARVRIGLGSDEESDVVAAIAGHLAAGGHDVERLALGAEWPEVGRAVAEAVAQGDADVGVVCCYTGTGVSMAANKVLGVRCALCTDGPTATGARRWNDANVLALSLRLTSVTLAGEIVDAFLAAVPDAETPSAVARLERTQG